MDRKRVGIITLPGNYNYGNRLQCYAMSSIIRQAGFETDVLEREHPYVWYHEIYRRMKRSVISLLGISNVNDAESIMSDKRLEAFYKFSNCIPTRILPGDGSKCSVDYDYFVVGSDQVWNPYFIRRQESWFFATFARPEQRIAIAASLGIESFANEKQARRIVEGVQGFEYVSVREESGAKLIQNCSGIKAEVICDPTLILKPEEWRSIASSECTPPNSYVFTYLLGGNSSETTEILEEVTEHGCIPIVSLSDRQKWGEPDAGPAEFIDLIDNAEHVVTDSFHAAVFSSILEKPLTIVHRKGDSEMFSRLEQLCHILGIENKIYESISYDYSCAGEYNGVFEAICRERNKFMSYLQQSLHFSSDEMLKN